MVKTPDKVASFNPDLVLDVMMLVEWFRVAKHSKATGQPRDDSHGDCFE